tara:strand:- start:221 stop:328 length:108 start_codon:yes stop_codon:yes gene_type:complete
MKHNGAFTMAGAAAAIVLLALPSARTASSIEQWQV